MITDQERYLVLPTARKMRDINVCVLMLSIVNGKVAYIAAPPEDCSAERLREMLATLQTRIKAEQPNNQ